MYQSGRAGDKAKKRKSPAKSGRVGISTFETKSSYCRVALPCYTAVARLGFKRRAIAVPNSIHNLQMH